MNNEIGKWRAEIDAIDEELLGLLNRRARVAAEIGAAKKRRGAPLCDPDRERDVLSTMDEMNEGPLDAESVERIFRNIINESRRIQTVEPPSSLPAVTVPKWDRVTVVGCGLIGASFALALRRTGAIERIAGWDIDQRVLQEALRRRIIDEVDFAFAGDCVSESDLVYLAMPVSAIVDFLHQHGSQIKKGALVTDAGSTKVEICDAAREYLPAAVSFVGGHPIAGSQHSGLGYADHGLFSDARYVLVDNESEREQAHKFSATVEAMGAQIRFMTAEEHDRSLAFVSHLPQILASTLAATALSEKDHASLLDLTGRGWRAMTRLAGSSWLIWADILRTNRAQINAALDIFSRRLSILRDELRQAGPSSDLPAAGEIFNEGNRLSTASPGQAVKQNISSPTADSFRYVNPE